MVELRQSSKRFFNIFCTGHSGIKPEDMPRPKVFKNINTINTSSASLSLFTFWHTHPLTIELEPIRLRFEIDGSPCHSQSEFIGLA